MLTKGFSTSILQRFLLNAGIAAIIFCNGVSSQGCEYLNVAKKALKSRPIIFADNDAVEKYQASVKVSVKASLRDYYKQYRSQHVENFSDQCFVGYPELKAKFIELLPIVFLDESFKELSLLQTPVASKFYQLVIARYNAGTLLGIHLIGHSEEAPTIYPAGYKRGDNSIFMNLEKIKGSDWLLVLTHELLHAVDPFLANATDVFGSELSLDVEKIANSSGNLNWQQLPAVDQTKIDTFLIAGLDRGFLAEVRAWVRTLQIYEEGLQNNYFPQISWMNNLLASSGRNANERVLNTLDQNFYPQKEWIFAQPLIRDRVVELRQQIREHPEQIKEIPL